MYKGMNEEENLPALRITRAEKHKLNMYIRANKACDNNNNRKPPSHTKKKRLLTKLYGYFGGQTKEIVLGVITKGKSNERK